MRFLIPTILILVSALSAMADDDTKLRNFLSLLSGAHIGDDYDAIKKLVPNIEALHPDAGDNNTEALIKTKAGKIALRGEFNFSEGHLVSHGFETGELTHSEAHEFLLRCITILEQLYGPSERHINLPTEGDGPKDSIGMSFNWYKNKTFFGLDFRYRRNFATVSWGAQAE